MSDSNRRHTPSLGVISTIFGCVLLICFANSVSREDSRSFSIKNSSEKALVRFLKAAPYFIQPCAKQQFFRMLRYIQKLCKVFATLREIYRIEAVIFNANSNSMRDIIKARSIVNNCENSSFVEIAR